MTAQFIPTFIISSQAEFDVKDDLMKEFSGKEEFTLNFIEPIADKSDPDGLWQTIQHIIRKAIETDLDYILLCRNNHRFLDNYSKDGLLDSIRQAKELRADVLCGDARSFASALRVSKNMFWVENLPESSFTIIFSSLFSGILTEGNRIFLSTNRKFFIYPFISFSPKPEQLHTKHDSFQPVINEPGLEVSQQVELLDYISTFYEDLSNKNGNQLPVEDIDNIVIPTYIINLPERTERVQHIKKQFAGRDEFDFQIIEACRNRIGAVGLWETIRKIIKIAIENDDDVIIICEDDHEFTSDYSKSFLLKNIMEAYLQQAEMLLGGICGLARALPITNNRAWISYSHCLQFTVLYKPIFQKILDEPYDDEVVPDILLSDLVINKMVLFPFISVQKYFGYSDVSKGNNDDKEMVERNFAYANRRLKKIYEAKAVFID